MDCFRKAVIRQRMGRMRNLWASVRSRKRREADPVQYFLWPSISSGGEMGSLNAVCCLGVKAINTALARVGCEKAAELVITGKAAEYGSPRGQMLLRPRLPRRDRRGSRRCRGHAWVRRRRNQRYGGEGMHQLGVCYVYGDGVEQNWESCCVFVSARRQRVAGVAMTDLGYRYEKGRGVSRVGSRPFPGYRSEGRECGNLQSMHIWDAAMKRAAARGAELGSRPFPGIAEVRSAATKLVMSNLGLVLYQTGYGGSRIGGKP